MGGAAFTLVALGALPIVAYYLWHTGPTSPPPTARTVVELFSMFSSPAVLAGLFGALLAGQLLHSSRRRAYSAATLLPVLTTIGLSAVIRGLSWTRDSAGQFVEGMVWFVTLGLMFVGWIIIPIGWLATWWLRRRYLRPSSDGPAGVVPL